MIKKFIIIRSLKNWELFGEFWIKLFVRCKVVVN